MARNMLFTPKSDSKSVYSVLQSVAGFASSFCNFLKLLF